MVVAYRHFVYLVVHIYLTGLFYSAVSSNNRIQTLNKLQ
jgi:hypothetical protein